MKKFAVSAVGMYTVAQILVRSVGTKQTNKNVLTILLQSDILSENLWMEAAVMNQYQHITMLNRDDDL